MADIEKRIKEAWEIIIECRPDTIPSEEELRQSLHFTKGFPEQQTKNLPKKYIYFNGKTISKLFVSIIIILLLTSTLTVYAVVQLLHRHINDENTDISLNVDDTGTTEIQDRYFPFSIPENYYEVERYLTDNSAITRYTDGNHNIYFRQELPTSEGSFDNENTEENLFVINGNEAIYSEKHGEKTLIYSGFGYIFYIDTNSEDIAKEQMIKMAESIKKESRND